MLALADRAIAGRPLVYVARDDLRMIAMRDALSLLVPQAELLLLPAWDCLPFDRLSPQGSLVGQRIESLARLLSLLQRAEADRPVAPTVLLTTVNAFIQRVPPQTYFADSALCLSPGDEIGPAGLSTFLGNLNYLRTDTVRETGEFAVRGGIVDIFPPGSPTPVRLDFFGDELETIRSFDAASQRGGEKCPQMTLRPVAEFHLDAETIERFRSGYLVTFGAQASRDSLYESVSRAHAPGNGTLAAAVPCQSAHCV